MKPLDATAANGLTPTVLRLYLGQPYRYSHGGLYAPLCFARHARTGADVVCYVGLDGADKGRHYVADLNDWEQRFTRVVAEESLPRMGSPRAAKEGTPLQKVAGLYTTGSGV